MLLEELHLAATRLTRGHKTMWELRLNNPAMERFQAIDLESCHPHEALGSDASLQRADLAAPSRRASA